MKKFIPSIWLGDFSEYNDWLSAGNSLSDSYHLRDAIDDRQFFSRHPFNVDALCVQCDAIKQMTVSWHICGTNDEGSVHPAWTETAVCSGCGLNSRMRALIAFLAERLNLDTSSKVYIAEQVTPVYGMMKDRYPSTIGSEYLGDQIPSGAMRDLGSGCIVRHEDLTSLSFDSEIFDLVITQDVFEHIPDYKAAFKECKRVLAPEGILVFTIPFFPHQQVTEVRSVIENDELRHILPPEYHGNPVGDSTSLCFQHFGWDMLDDLRGAGFRYVTANMYWGPWQGHFGSHFFVFSAHCNPNLNYADVNRCITEIVQQKDAQIAKLHESLSWKITAPLRKIHGRLFG